MAKQILPTDFKDDVLSEGALNRRKYVMISNGDGTVSFDDVTDYFQRGSTFGAAQVNQTNEAVNNSVGYEDIVDNLLSASDSLPLSAKQGKILNEGKQDNITGAASTITDSNLTESRALVSDSSGKVAVSAVTATELGYLDGSTGNVQEQINNIITERSKNNFGEFIDLTNYKSTFFTVPCDGYLSLRATYRPGGKAECSLYGATGDDFIPVQVCGGKDSNDITNTSDTLFVRKGMRVTGVTKSSEYDMCRFISLV